MPSGEGVGSIILEQPLDVIEFLLRAAHIAKPLAQFLDDAAGALNVDLTRHFHRRVVAVLMPAQRPAKRIGILLGARLAEPADTAGTLALPHLLLHRLRQRLRPLTQSIERAPLGVDGVVGIAVAKIAFGIAHGLAGTAELVGAVLALPLAILALLVLAQAVVLQLLEQFVEAIAQRLLVLLELAHSRALLLTLARLALAARRALRIIAALLLPLLECAVAQILLLTDHVAELI